MLTRCLLALWALLLCAASTEAKTVALAPADGQKLQLHPLSEAQYKHIVQLANSAPTISTARLIRKVNSRVAAGEAGVDDESRTLTSNDLNENFLHLLRIIQGRNNTSNSKNSVGSTPLCVIKVSDMEKIGEGGRANNDDAAVNCVVVVKSKYPHISESGPGNGEDGEGGPEGEDGEGEGEKGEEDGDGVGGDDRPPHGDNAGGGRPSSNKPVYRPIFPPFPFLPWYSYPYDSRYAGRNDVKSRLSSQPKNKKIRKQQMKNHERQTQPLDPGALRALQQYYAQFARHEDSDYQSAFPSANYGFDPYQFYTNLYNPTYAYRPYRAPFSNSAEEDEPEAEEADKRSISKLRRRLHRKRSQ